jgi:hypothetical protein
MPYTHAQKPDSSGCCALLLLLLLLVVVCVAPGALVDSDNDTSEEEPEYDFGTAGSFKQSASMLYKANVSSA